MNGKNHNLIINVLSYSTFHKRLEGKIFFRTLLNYNKEEIYFVKWSFRWPRTRKGIPIKNLMIKLNK